MVLTVRRSLGDRASQHKSDEETFLGVSRAAIFRLVKPSPDQRGGLERFARMGLSGNPFRVVPPAEIPGLYAPPLDGQGPSAADIARSGARCVQILGREGFGKSILLATVGGLLEDEGLCCERRYLPPHHDGIFVEPRGGVDVLLLDEAQRLTRKARRAARLWYDDGGQRRLVMTTHEDLRRAFGRELESLEIPAADAAAIDRVFRRRIEFSGGDSESIRLSPRGARWLESECGGCLRRVEEFCYELFQAIEATREIVIDDGLLRGLGRRS